MANAPTTTSKTAPKAANKTLEAGKATLDLARKTTLKMIDDIPAGKICHQPVAKANHALWVLGHVACTDDYFLTSVGGAKPLLDESWSKRFGSGSTPGIDAKAYPSLADVKAAAAKTRAALVKWFESMDDAKFGTAFTGDMVGFAPNYGTLPISIAWHEGFHSGQISAVRRSLGLPNAMGF